jgi:hypothetical protein
MPAPAHCYSVLLTTWNTTAMAKKAMRDMRAIFLEAFEVLGDI